MINLLPFEVKKQLRAATTNVLLLRYVIITAVSVAFLLLIAGGAYLILTNLKTSAEKTIADNQANYNAYNTIKSATEDLQNSLNSAQAVMNGDIDYTGRLTKLASLMPAGVILDSWTISYDTPGKGDTLQILAKDQAAVDQFQTSLQNSNLVTGPIVIKNKTSVPGSYPISLQFSLTWST